MHPTIIAYGLEPNQRQMYLHKTPCRLYTIYY